MTEGHEVRADREEVEAFVGRLRGFYGGLQTSAERAMLESILESAQGGETGGFAFRRRRYEDPTAEEGSGSESSSGWNDLIGWIEEQGEEDTQGFAFRRR